jgi:hypothetical protein
MSHKNIGRSKKLHYLVKWLGYPNSDNTWKPAHQVHALDLVKQYHRSNPLLTIKTQRVTTIVRCELSPKLLQQNPNLSLIIPSLSRKLPSSSNLVYNHGNSSSSSSTVNHLTMLLSIPTSAKTTPALTTTPTEFEPCPSSPSMLWSRHPLALHPPYSPP